MKNTLEIVYDIEVEGGHSYVANGFVLASTPAPAMKNILDAVELAADLKPMLEKHLVGKRVKRIEWHDGHGDVLIVHMDDDTRLRVCSAELVAKDLVCNETWRLSLSLTKEA
jgi:hypothetical protein